MVGHLTLTLEPYVKKLIFFVEKIKEKKVTTLIFHLRIYNFFLFKNKFTILAIDLKNLIAPHGPEIALN